MAETNTIIVTQDKIDRLNGLLGDFCNRANTVWSLLITIYGQLLVQKGFIYSFDILTISALVCGVFNSTMELARIVGENKFDQFLQEGKKFCVYYIGVNKEYLLVSLFDDRTLPGVVKVAGKEFSREAVKILRNES